MSRFQMRLILFAAIVLGWLVLACSASNLLPQREARITTTPTRTPKPTFTATAMATPTLVPSLTPTPSNTPTDTPPPTDTPLPSDTPAPTLTPSVTPTASPTVPPTATRRPPPTRTPVPVPTKTPAPPFTVAIYRGYPHCGGYAGVTGTVKHAGGSPFPGVAVGVWSPTWVGSLGISNADGKFDIPLNNLPYGEYQVAVVKQETCAQEYGLPTAIQCQRLSNVMKVTVTEDCNVNRVTELAITGP